MGVHLRAQRSLRNRQARLPKGSLLRDGQEGAYLAASKLATKDVTASERRLQCASKDKLIGLVVKARPREFEHLVSAELAA